MIIQLENFDTPTNKSFKRADLVGKANKQCFYLYVLWVCFVDCNFILASFGLETELISNENVIYREATKLGERRTNGVHF